MRDDPVVGLAPTRRDRLLRRGEVLYLALRDLWDVALCVDFLLDHEGPVTMLDVRVRQTLEAGMLVTYARPFSGRNGRTISRAPDLSEELREFHDDIVTRRNKVYAHTDLTEVRQIIDFRAPDGLDVLLSDDGSTVIREQWDSLTDNGLFCLRELAHVHYDRSLSELDRLRVRLGTVESENETKAPE